MTVKKIVDRERPEINTDEIFRLMRGDGNQSRINDGQRVVPDRK